MSETTHAQFTRQAFCQYCGGKLNLGYYFMCHVCGSAYCYIHMTRHDRAHAPAQVLDKIYAK
jgi:hypothetical protein